jgi:hypothetical protein
LKATILYCTSSNKLYLLSSKKYPPKQKIFKKYHYSILIVLVSFLYCWISEPFVLTLLFEACRKL